jgi:hypothetical protein
MARVNQGECLQDLKRYEEAQSQMRDGYNRLKSSLGEGHARTRGAAKSLADLYLEWGKPGEEAQWRALLHELKRPFHDPRLMSQSALSTRPLWCLLS